MLRLLYRPGIWAPRNLAPPRASWALIVVKLCKSRFTAICGLQIARQNALAGCEIFRDRNDWEALEDDSPMDDETFVFGSLWLIPAQRMLPEDRKPLHLGSRALDILTTLVENADPKRPADRPHLARYCRRRGALRVHVAALRTALGDGRAGNRHIAKPRRPDLLLFDEPTSALDPDWSARSSWSYANSHATA